MAKDVAQRELDQAGFRIANLGDPTAAGDATKTDNTTVPLPPAATGSAGKSFLAAPIDHVHPVGAGPGGGGLPIVTVSASGYQKVIGTTEEVIYEEVVDLNPLGTPKMEVAFSGLFKVEGSGPDGVSLGTFRVRLGGTAGAPDGTELASVGLPVTDFRLDDSTSKNVDNPGRHQLVKITAQGAVDGITAHSRARSIQFRARAGA